MAEVDALLKLYYAGKVEPVRVELQAAILPPAVRLVRDDYALVRGLRLWAGDTRPVPYGREWVAGRVDLAPVTVGRALDALVAASVLRRGDPLPPRNGWRNGTHTFVEVQR
ncbi:MAG: hypothetical protein ACXVHB_28825 [Solirubrobacteraceae bacterium]